MPVARAWSLDAARRARLGFSGSKTKLAFWKSNVRASCAEAATSQQHATRQFTCLQRGRQTVANKSRNDEREGTRNLFRALSRFVTR